MANLVPGIYNATPPSLGDKDQVQLQMDSAGNLKTTATIGGAANSTTNPLFVATGTAGEAARAEFDLILSLDTSAYAAGDVLFDSQEVATFFAVAGGFAVLEKLIVYDEDDQGVAMDIHFFNANTSLGTENSAPSITDTNARTRIGHLRIAADDYIDLGGSKTANLLDIQMTLKAAAAATSVWVGGITQGTPTHAAAGVRLKFVVRY